MAKKRSNKMIKVDFTGVSTEGGGRLLPEEQFKFEVKEVEQETGESSGEPYLKITLEVVDGEMEGTKAWDNMSLQPQALWKLRGFMEAVGLETVEGEMDIDPDEFVGLVVLGNVIHETYKNKPKHRIDSYESVDGDATAAADDKPASGSRKKKADDAEAETEWKKGQKVTFMDGKKKLKGTIAKIDDDKVDILVKGVSKDADGEYEMTTADIEAA